MHNARMRNLFALVLVLAALLAACNGDDPALTTTSTLVAGTGADGGAGSTSTSAPTTGATTSTTLVGEAVASYEIVAREPVDDGEVIYVVIPPGAYTDVDLENFILDLYEQGIATYGAEVFNDQAASTAYLKAEADRTAEETTAIAEHHLVSLVGGTTIVFRGPFAESGQHSLGS
jgi:hypothetical protein